MKKIKKNDIVALIGLLLLGTGLLLIKRLDVPGGILSALPYICIGIGCGMLGYGLDNIFLRTIIKRDPTIQKQLEISRNDERNIMIANQAKAKAYDMMTFIFGGLLLIFALIRVSLIAILLLVFAYLFVQGSGLYYRCKYDKEM